MINLTPNKEKKEMVRGFYFRLLALFLLMVSASFFVAFLSIFPAYLLSSAKNNIIDIKLETQRNEPVPVPDEDTLADIRDIDTRLSLIENAELNKFAVSNRVINAIISKKMPNIKITDISFKNELKTDLTQEKKISIQGTAPSRELLLLFRKALEDDSNFKSVDLPISNFIKGSDIEFYLSLISS